MRSLICIEWLQIRRKFAQIRTFDKSRSLEWRTVCRPHGFFGGFTLMNLEKIERDENRITGFTSSAFLLILFLYVSNNTSLFDLAEALSGQ